MDFKRLRKSISRFFGWLGLIACSLIIKFTPEVWLYRLAKNIACLGYHLAGKHRRIAQESLSIAFAGEKTLQEIDRIVRDCFEFLAKAGVEIFFLLDKPALLKKKINLVGKENLDTALACGKGVILVSAHFGNFPLLLGRLSLEGYTVGSIVRSMRDSRAEKIFLEKRKRLKIKTIYSQPRNICVESTLRALRNNEIVFIPLDQNFGTGGVFVDFFGRKAATATGPVILAQRTGASVIPCFIFRQKDDTHRIIFEQPLRLEVSSSSQETIRINVQKITTIIESYIRRYPAEWGWIHRRWKSRPTAEGGG